ncbi:MAG: nucleotide disphospho-sugar-binding domain-containing protein [Acidobacteriota bacterium]
MRTDRHSLHFGVLPFTGTGHLNPLIALGQELTRSGHRVTFFERPRVRERVEEAGLGFVPIRAERSTHAAKPTGVRAELATLRFNLQRVTQEVESYLRETPAVLERVRIDALLVNEIAVTGPTLAQQLGLPYFIISTSVPHNCGWSAYPWYAGYRLVRSPVSLLERALLEVSAVRLRGPIRRTVDRYRKLAGLGAVSTIREIWPPLAHITQLPRCLDFPEGHLPENCHYTGPFGGGSARPPVEFPWERLDGRPIAYASLGTTRNAQAGILRMIAEACHGLDLQLVISLGGRFAPEMFADLPGTPLVVSLAPQLELLQCAEIVITHGGSNTVFEALSEGKPMVVIPLAHDQPAIAARLAQSGAGRVLPVMRLSAQRVRTAVSTVLADPAFRKAAMTLQTQIRTTCGAERAVEIIEEALCRRAELRRRSTAA